MTDTIKLQERIIELIFMLADLQLHPDQEISISPDENGFLTLELREKLSGKVLNSFDVTIPIICGEQELPLPSLIEWDETTQQIQQRFPAKFTFVSQKPRYRVHLAGKAPSLRWKKPHPFSHPEQRAPRKRRRGRGRRISSAGRRFNMLSVEQVKEAVSKLELDFLTPA